MSDYDRGPYTPPSEPPLAFDPRRPVRGSGPLPITLIISVVVLVLAAGGAFFVYRGGVRSPGDAPQPVGAPVRDVKTAAPPEAQPTDPTTGLSVYKDNPPGAAQPPPVFTAPPEAPGPRPAPGAVAVAPAKPVPATPAAMPTPAKPATIASILASKPVAAIKPAPTPVGVAFVQIGAYSSAALAEKGWADAARIAPAAMTGKGKKVEPVAKDGATLYRTSITGFSTKAEAVALCDQLKAAGKTCFAR